MCKALKSIPVKLNEDYLVDFLHVCAGNPENLSKKGALSCSYYCTKACERLVHGQSRSTLRSAYRKGNLKDTASH